MSKLIHFISHEVYEGIKSINARVVMASGDKTGSHATGSHVLLLSFFLFFFFSIQLFDKNICNINIFVWFNTIVHFDT